MWKYLTFAALLAALAAAPAARADAPATQPTTTAAPDVKIETQVLGKAIVIGPDGKVQTVDLNTGVPGDVLNKLPKEIQDEVGKAVGQAFAETLGGAGKAPAGTSGMIGKMKVITIGPDGKTHETDSDLNLPGLHGGNLDEILKKAGVDLPAEARDALKAGNKNPALGAKADEISAKLDKILDRLDKLEKEIGALRAKSGQ